MSGIPYNAYKIVETYEYKRWYKDQNINIKNHADSRIGFISEGHFGDFKRFDGLIEFRWKNGLRMYGMTFKHTILILLIGGNKNGQDRDIKKAKKIKAEIINGTRSVLITSS